MSQATDITQQLPLAWPSYIAGEPVQTGDSLEVRYPWDGSLTGTLPRITPDQLEQAIQAALGQAQPPTRNERYEILMRVRDLLAARADEFANLIRLESGLCMRETRYEVGRAQEVFKFAAAEALRDD
ncbi:MAG TPA: aldehyde dehydrogenase family protein, partial [Verrucomicrobiota bacterium]|nr:aldehyde dehydrogenase family protein [Verrucomicrobiota bacterium]